MVKVSSQLGSSALQFAAIVNAELQRSLSLIRIIMQVSYATSNKGGWVGDVSPHLYHHQLITNQLHLRNPSPRLTTKNGYVPWYVFSYAQIGIC